MNALLDDNTMMPWRGIGPCAVVLGELEVRPVLPGEMQRVAALLNDEHFLGDGCRVGRTLVRIVHHGERWAVILVRGPACSNCPDHGRKTRSPIMLVEAFTDIESFEGTCYKASNWEPCGLTKGSEHKRLKKL